MKTADAMSKWMGSQEPDESVCLSFVMAILRSTITSQILTWLKNHKGYSLANDNKTLYQIMSADPVRSAKLADGMKAFATSPGFAVSHVL